MNCVFRFRHLAAMLAAIFAVMIATPSRAEVSEVSISKGYGILYLPLIVRRICRVPTIHGYYAG